MTTPAEARSDATQQLRDKILAQPDLKTLLVEGLEEWPELVGSIFVRSLTAAERSSFERSMNFDPHGNPRNIENLQTRLAVLAMVAADGSRIFDEADVEALAKKSASALQTIFNAAAELNGLSEQAVERAAKN